MRTISIAGCHSQRHLHVLARLCPTSAGQRRERRHARLAGRPRADLERPCIEAALGDREQPAHDTYRIVGLVCLQGSQERFGVAVLSFANQAAAFDKISRSILSCGSHAADASPASRRSGRPYAFTAFPLHRGVSRRTEPFARGLLRKELMKLSHQVRIV